MSSESEFFGLGDVKLPTSKEQIHAMLKANELPIGQSIIPEADKCRARPCLVQARDGSAMLYLEIVIPPPVVHAMMHSVPALQANCSTLAGDAAQVLYDFVLRARGTYFEGRKGK